jgi:hypothetical protein
MTATLAPSNEYVRNYLSARFYSRHILLKHVFYLSNLRSTLSASPSSYCITQTKHSFGPGSEAVAEVALPFSLRKRNDSVELSHLDSLSSPSHLPSPALGYAAHLGRTPIFRYLQILYSRFPSSHQLLSTTRCE